MALTCPFCQSDNLMTIVEGDTTTQCCEDCGGSFEVVQEPQDILLDISKQTFSTKDGDAILFLDECNEPYEKMRG